MAETMAGEMAEPLVGERVDGLVAQWAAEKVA